MIVRVRVNIMSVIVRSGGFVCEAPDELTVAKHPPRGVSVVGTQEAAPRISIVGNTRFALKQTKDYVANRCETLGDSNVKTMII